MVPSITDIIRIASPEHTDDCKKMRTRHSGSEIVPTLTSPAVVLQIVHKAHFIRPFVFFVSYKFVDWAL